MNDISQLTGTRSEHDQGMPESAVAPRLITVGLSHRTASADVRGRLSFSLEETEAVTAYLADTAGVHECALLSTCNRTEIYAFAQGRQVGSRLLEKLANWRNLDAEELTPYLYSLDGRESIRHLFRVASGLDSMVLGETQILGQVKRAFLVARQRGTVDATLLRLLEHALAGAKLIRTQTGIGGCPVSLAGAATSQVQRAINSPEQASALVVGAGENADLILHHLSSRGIGEIWVANRTAERAQQLARKYGVNAVALNDIDDILPRMDVVISSTASDRVVLDTLRIRRAVEQRGQRELLLLDLAVPHDIEPDAGNLPGVLLYSADDLGRLARENIHTRREAARQAESIVDEEVCRYLEWLRKRASVPAIKTLRQQAEQHRQTALKRALRRLNNGMSAEEALDYLSHQLNARLLHTPTRALTRATVEDDSGETMRTLSRLLDLDEDE